MLHRCKRIFQFCLVLFLISCNAELEKRPATELVSHRGYISSGLNENSIESFYQAINDGFDSIETDLRLHNGDIVLSHDKTLSSEQYTSSDELLLFAVNNQVRLWLEVKEPEVIEPMLELLN
jgi:glycerophosphoryl diester phosphodiesterase